SFNKYLLNVISAGTCAKFWDIISGSKILTASLLTYPVLRTLSLQLLSVVTGSYVSGTYSIVLVNCPNEQIARDIARAVLDKKLAASVNILPKASSLYYWNGEIEEATEVLLVSEAGGWGPNRERVRAKSQLSISKDQLTEVLAPHRCPVSICKLVAGPGHLEECCFLESQRSEGLWTWSRDPKPGIFFFLFQLIKTKTAKVHMLSSYIR
uniref:Protein CutA n=1 Tax=Moschus moschiferus TaxID=68415 RepID=A0A8C6FPD6_MOSMO